MTDYIRMIGRFIRGTFVFLVITIFCLWLLATTPYVQEKLMTAVKSAVYDATGSHVDIQSVSFDFPRSIAAKGVTISQPPKQTPWIQADKVVVKVDVKALWEGRFEPLSITVSGAQLNALPNVSPETPPIPPLVLKVESLDIHPSLLEVVEGLSRINIKGLFNLDLSGSRLLSGDADVGIAASDRHSKVRLGFVLTQDLTLAGAYHAKIENMEVYGDIHISPSLAVDGTSLHLGKTPIEHIAAAFGIPTDIDGNLTVDAAFTGPLHNIDAVVLAEVDKTKDIGPVKSRIMAKIGGGHITGAMQLNADIDGKEFAASADYAWEGNPFIALTEIQIKSMGITFEGNADYYFEEKWAEGTLNGRVEEEALLPHVKGDLSLTAHFIRSPEPTFIITAESPNLAAEDAILNEVVLEATINNVYVKPQAEVQLTADKIAKGPYEIHAIEATTTFDSLSERWPLVINATLGSGTVATRLSFDKSSVSGATTFEGVHLEELLPMHGVVSGQASIGGTFESPEGSIQLHGDNLIYDYGAEKPYPVAFGDLSASITSTALTCAGMISSPGHPPINFDCHLPVAFSLSPPGFAFEDQLPIEGHVAATGDITPLLQLVSGNAVPFSGNASASISVAGTLASPQMKGTCDLTDGFYEIPAIGVSLYQLTGHIEAEGPVLTVTHLSANDGQGGTLSGHGQATLNPESHFPFQLDLELSRAFLLNQDYVKAICSGPLTFKGDTTGGQLEGNFVLNGGSILIPERPEAVINSVDVIYINVSQDERLPQPLTMKKSQWPLNLAIRLNIPENLSITGRDLKSTWRGALDIGGTAGQTAINGELHVVSGQYLFNGNPFEINKGTITFAGDVDKKTTMYVIATKDLDRVNIDVIAKGPVKNPGISFRSNPPLPQREILSWILFNSGTNEISPFQGTQLSESITNLKANQQGPDVLTKVRSTLGIDRFEITRNQNSGSESEVNVQVGKYIYDNVLVSVIKSDVNSLAVEAALSNRVRLQAQVGDDAQGKLILKWKRNY